MIRMGEGGSGTLGAMFLLVTDLVTAAILLSPHHHRPLARVVDYIQYTMYTVVLVPGYGDLWRPVLIIR